jgi:hypothetical protein
MLGVGTRSLTMLINCSILFQGPVPHARTNPLAKQITGGNGQDAAVILIDVAQSMSQPCQKRVKELQYFLC